MPAPKAMRMWLSCGQGEAKTPKIHAEVHLECTYMRMRCLRVGASTSKGRCYPPHTKRKREMRAMYLPSCGLSVAQQAVVTKQESALEDVQSECSLVKSSGGVVAVQPGVCPRMATPP